jgi:hypothetical protein
MMNSFIFRFLAVVLSFYVAQAVTSIGNDSNLRGGSQEPSLAVTHQIEKSSHLRALLGGNDHSSKHLRSYHFRASHTDSLENCDP